MCHVLRNGSFWSGSLCVGASVPVRLHLGHVVHLQNINMPPQHRQYCNFDGKLNELYGMSGGSLMSTSINSLMSATQRS